MKEKGKNIHKENHIWMTVLTREGPLMVPSFVAEGSSHKNVKEMLGVDFGYSNYRCIKGEISVDLNEGKIVGNLIMQQIQKNPNYLKDYIETCRNQGEKLLATARRISKIENLTSFSDNQLLELYEQYAQELLRYMPFLIPYTVMMRILEGMISNKLKKKLSEIDKENPLDEYMASIIIPSRENWVTKQLRDLLKITAEIQNEPKSRKVFVDRTSEKILEQLKNKYKQLFSCLKDHAETFGFLDMYWYMGSPTTIEAVILRIKDLIKEDCKERLKRIDKQEEEAEQKYKAIIKELKISGNLLTLIEQAREHAYFRLHRMDTMFQAGFYVRNLMEEIGKRMGLSYDDVLNLTRNEIVCFLKEGTMPNLDRVKEIRKTGYAYLLIEGKTKIVTGEELEDFIEEKKVEETRQLEGVIACPGTHTGTAKIVTSVKDIEKVKDNDVLVSIMTQPVYLPALIRAGAVITEEGGVLSHAAIVSRELGKPCVIGTNIATKVFVDGDLLEVDATGTKGIVRLQKKATLQSRR